MALASVEVNFSYDKFDARSAHGKQESGHDDGNQSKSICYIHDRGCGGTHGEGAAAT